MPVPPSVNLILSNKVLDNGAVRETDGLVRQASSNTGVRWVFFLAVVLDSWDGAVTVINIILEDILSLWRNHQTFVFKMNLCFWSDFFF